MVDIDGGQIIQVSSNSEQPLKSKLEFGVLSFEFINMCKGCGLKQKPKHNSFIKHGQTPVDRRAWLHVKSQGSRITYNFNGCC